MRLACRSACFLKVYSEKGVMKKLFQLKTGFAVLILIFVVLTSFRSIHQDDWIFLGERKVSFVRDKDVFTLHTNDRLSAVRMKVEGRDISISEVKVYFQNGDKMEPAIDGIVRAGENSRVIDLPENGRHITKIEFKYRTVGSVLKGKADIQLYGRKAL